MVFDSHAKTISTNRLLLRLFQESDAYAVATLCNNYNIYKNTLYLPFPYSIEDALSWMKNHIDNYHSNTSYEFAITDRESGELYGAVALSNNVNLGQGELAYWVGEAYWGNGYATEAARAMVQFAFDEKNYHKVFARYFGSNPASGKVMEKIGMKKEGILIDHVKKDERYEDMVYYGIVNQQN
ncbi:GNAT family N-acetyltransferase [Ureibacillus aquaedulcis]|uniref:GNAT family N-acetyltransferase n=1 Tax=Ureibacillus aquaedulcis TaxID=3058421 RepID=A0ABT8GMU2_9BACL|nr:GNAT family N-acetyltransferase [Ureibacillus sp. BA0131]MDN4492735.1 GNAT family N-acetyltransferase [Ureibacillus sp. BA0131]